MNMRLADIGASVEKRIEVGDLDTIELGSRETTWLGSLCKTTERGVPTSRTIVTTKPASLNAGFFKTFSVTS